MNAVKSTVTKTKAVKASAPKIARTDRKRFYYIRTKGRFGMLSAKVENVDEALKVHGIAKVDVTESKELSTNRHDSVVMFCEILAGIQPASNVSAPLADQSEQVLQNAKG